MTKDVEAGATVIDTGFMSNKVPAPRGKEVEYHDDVCVCPPRRDATTAGPRAPRRENG